MKYSSQILNIILLFVLLIAFTNLCFYYKKMENYKIASDSLKLELKMLQGNIKLHYNNTGRIINDFEVIDSNGNEILFSSLLNKKEKFVYKFSLQNCFSCINHELLLIKKFNNILNDKNSLIVIDSCSIRDLNLFKKFNNLESLPIYRMAKETNDINLILKKEEIPFVFFINNQMQVKDLFIPMKEYPYYSEEYHKDMFDKYSYL